MKQEWKDKWLAALRSGEYDQGTGNLRCGDNKFCCLGVLTDLVIKENPEIGSWYENHWFAPTATLEEIARIKNDGVGDGYDGDETEAIQELLDDNADDESLPVFIQQLVGMNSLMGDYKVMWEDETGGFDGDETTLAEDNDSGSTFLEIAEIIEKKWAEL